MHFKTIKPGLKIIYFWIFFVTIGCARDGEQSEGTTILPTGKPAEDGIDVFMGDPYIQKQIIDAGEHVRFPIITTGIDGTILVFWGHDRMNIIRSKDGGISWEDKKQFPPDLSFLVRHENVQYKNYNEFSQVNSMRIRRIEKNGK